MDAAVRIADAEGLDAVSMGRVAAKLGTAPMSLYRHVSAKEELLKLMVDAAWGDPPGPPAPGEGWRAGLSRWAWALRDSAKRHPWVVRIPLNSLPIMPREVDWFEHALACMGDTGLTEARKASVIMLLAGYVRNLATTEADIMAAIQASGLSPAEWMSSYPRHARAADRSAAVPRAHRVHRGRGLRRRGRTWTTSSSSAWTASWTASRISSTDGRGYDS